jgi:polyisoprenoid-binding protein YceI
MRIKKLIVAVFATSVLWFNHGAKARTYEIDPVHSSISFWIDHIGFGPILGVVYEYSGQFDFNADNLAASKVEAKLKVVSINTGSKRRDGDIQGADWFNAAEFPEISFVGKGFTQTGANTGNIVGKMTIAGVSRDVTLDVKFNKEADNPFDKSHVAGFSARATILRSDFGMKTYLPLVGDRVDVVIEVEGAAKK